MDEEKEVRTLAYRIGEYFVEENFPGVMKFFDCGEINRNYRIDRKEFPPTDRWNKAFETLRETLIGYIEPIARSKKFKITREWKLHDLEALRK